VTLPQLPRPEGLEWGAWSVYVLTELSNGYTLPNPVDEGLWQAWATELLNIAGISELGVADPRSFGEDWRAWAAAFILTAS
jgi:hypothetical protein